MFLPSMVPYMWFAAGLSFIAFLHVLLPLSRAVRNLSALLLIIVAGLRFQSGYDWLVYEDLMEDVQYWAETGREGFRHGVDPLFQALAVNIGILGGGLQALVFVCSAVNIYLVNRVVGRISPHQPIVWLVYFGVLFIPAQMSTIRQAVASSVVILGLWLLTSRRLWSAWFFELVAVGLHVSTLMFLPLFVVGRYRLRPWIIYVVVSVGFATMLARIDLVGILIVAAQQIAPSWLAEKLSLYEMLGTSPLSIGAGALILLELWALFFLYRYVTSEEDKTRAINIARWLLLGQLVSHLFFPGFASIWNRFLYVSLPWAVAAMLGTKKFRSEKVFGRLIVTGAATVFCFSAFITLFNRSPIEPLQYVSMLQVWADPYRDFDGEQRFRAEEWISTFVRDYRRWAE